MKNKQAISYLTFGLTAPYYQYVNFPEEFKINDKISMAARIDETDIKIEYTYKEIKEESFSLRYRNFIKSPRSHWVYHTVFH